MLPLPWQTLRLEANILSPDQKVSEVGLLDGCDLCVVFRPGMPVRIKVVSASAWGEIVSGRSEDTVEHLKKKIQDLFGSESLETLALQKRKNCQLWVLLVVTVGWMCPIFSGTCCTLHRRWVYCAPCFIFSLCMTLHSFVLQTDLKARLFCVLMHPSVTAKKTKACETCVGYLSRIFRLSRNSCWKEEHNEIWCHLSLSFLTVRHRYGCCSLHR